MATKQSQAHPWISFSEPCWFFLAVPSIWNMRVVAFFKIDLPYERISDLYYGKEKTKKYVSVPKLVKRNRPSWFGLLSCLGKCIQGGSLGNKITVRFQTKNMTSSCSLLTNKESEKNLSSEQPPHIYGKKLIFFVPSDFSSRKEGF